MFGTIPIAYRVLGGIALFGAVFLGGVFVGYRHEHDLRISLIAKINQMGIDQDRLTKAKNAEYERNLNEANSNSSYAAQSISDYYRSHPVVRVQYSSSCGMPKTNDNPQSSNEASTTGYVSPYSPESTELVASQLDQLQKLLIANGVEVK